MSDQGTNAAVIGAFKQVLTRENKQIRKDRAESLIEDSQTVYRRKVEDLEIKLKRLRRDQNAVLDLSPDSAMSLGIKAGDFDPDKFANSDLDIAVEIRNLEIKYQVALERYTFLFGNAE